jgi:hypothetical protein
VSRCFAPQEKRSARRPRDKHPRWFRSDDRALFFYVDDAKASRIFDATRYSFARRHLNQWLTTLR